ncbi:metallophosphoesterase [Bradyrhizobium sp. 179]|uniref:metallophosphoesterase n=1 Tax=Bradyrhizobium sp. 179 TaxID=2782648 RepID=UPI001FF9A208|nr:metallophosphoesterase [Bradyrhizobium sp. 179]MCK1543320.1 metallophosphoesterase [Bradyrhizobium sp. 179]
MAKWPYLIVSDIHAHAWSAFSTRLPNGMNSRLKITLDEIDRAVNELVGEGGDTAYCAGDLLHTRGSMDPEVFNPLHKCIADNAADINWRIIPGNHDLKDRDTTELGNAIQTLGAIENVQIVTNRTGMLFPDHGVLMIPWHGSKDALRATIKELHDAHGGPAAGPAAMGSLDLIIHVGIDGVLAGVPDHGLSAEEVASWGFKRVFAGDYHNHKEMEGGKVYSIGATSHQQWGDIDTKAGFLLVYEDRVEYRASHAPSFVEITADDSEEDIPSIVDGNYVRVRGMKLTDAEINKFRAELVEMGAKGVTFQVTRETVSARGSTSVSKGTTLDQSVDSFIDQKKDIDLDLLPLVKASAAQILTDVRSVQS